MTSKAPQTPPGGSQPQKLDLGMLSAQQLLQVKKSLDEELEHLNSSFNQLRGAQQKFNDCARSIAEGVKDKQDKNILVPLTTSLYVPGTILDQEKVIVDIGTGFLVEKSTSDAQTFYLEKVQELGKNMKDLEGIMQGKANNLRTVEDVLRQKVVQGQSTQGASQSSELQANPG